MNRVANELRLAETRYVDPNGLPQGPPSARDLAVARHALTHSRVRPRLCTMRECGHSYEVEGAKGVKRTVLWTNTNRLLDTEGYDGVKTGTTTAAGACLVASGRRGTDHLIVVVLGARRTRAATTTPGTSSDGRGAARHKA